MSRLIDAFNGGGMLSAESLPVGYNNVPAPQPPPPAVDKQSDLDWWLRNGNRENAGQRFAHLSDAQKQYLVSNDPSLSQEFFPQTSQSTNVSGGGNTRPVNGSHGGHAGPTNDYAYVKSPGSRTPVKRDYNDAGNNPDMEPDDSGDIDWEGVEDLIKTGRVIGENRDSIVNDLINGLNSGAFSWDDIGVPAQILLERSGFELDPDLTGDSIADDLAGESAGDDLGPDTLSSLQQQVSTEIDDILSSDGDIDEWMEAELRKLEELMLQGGGGGVRVNGDGSLDFIFTVGIPGPGGVGELEIRDADGNFVLGDSVKGAVQGAWETVKSIPEKILDGAQDVIDVLKGEGTSIGGVDLSGDILDTAGNVIGTIFSGPMEGFMEENVWLTGETIASILDTINEDLDISPTPVTDGTKQGPPTLGTSTDVPIVDGPLQDDTVIPTDDVVRDGDDRVIRQDRVDPLPEEPPLGTIDGEVPIPRDGNDRVIPEDSVDPLPEEPPLGGIDGEVPIPRDGDDRVIPEDYAGPPPVEEPLGDLSGENFDNAPYSDGGGGGGGGGGGMMSGAYMGGLGYDLDAPRSILYDPRDPMDQLNAIINRSLFQGII